MTPEEVAKARELLTHEDPDIQRQGLELAKSFGDYSAVFEGCSIDEEGKIQLSVGSLTSIMLEERLPLAHSRCRIDHIMYQRIGR